MEKILFLAFTESDGTLAKSALEALGAAKNLSAELVVGLIGGDVQPGANQIAAAASHILGVSGEAFSRPRYSSDAAAAEAIAKVSGAAVILVAGGSRANRVMSGVASRLGGRADTHVASVAAESGRLRITRWYYRQRMEAVLEREQRPWVIVLDSGCAEAWSGAVGTAAVEAVPVAVSSRTTVTGIQSPPADEQTIRPEADLLFVTGAGWTKKQADGQPHVADAERLILDFLKVGKCSLGSSKSLVDISGEGQEVLKFLTHLNQVGQTGSTPRHPKGLATCCHGEEPHVVGWRFIGERRAVNLDANCGWARGKADVVYVADAFEVMSKVNALLGAAGANA